jgi:hypothetical protein
MPSSHDSLPFLISSPTLSCSFYFSPNLSNSVHRPTSSDLIFGGTKNLQSQIKSQIVKMISIQRPIFFKSSNQIVKSNHQIKSVNTLLKMLLKMVLQPFHSSFLHFSPIFFPFRFLTCSLFTLNNILYVVALRI